MRNFIKNALERALAGLSSCNHNYYRVSLIIGPKEELIK